MRTRAMLFARTKELVLVFVVIVLIVGLAGCAKPSTIQVASGPAGSCGTSAGDASGVPGVTPAMAANAKIVADYAMANGFGKQGVLVGITAAWTESTLNPDAVHPSGRWVGLFQMSAAWAAGGEDRRNPLVMTTMFYQGSPYGHPGLKDIAGWQQMEPGRAAATVEGNPTKLAQYIGNEGIAQQITDAIVIGPTECPGGGGGGTVNVALNGPSLTLPDDPNVAAAVRGKTIQTPSDGMAKGIAAGLRYLGAPYVWGGGGDGSGPNNGCSRGGGDYNSCGSEIGFDCSGLTAYVYVQGGFSSPGGNSGAQRAGGMSVPYAQGVPGDIVGFPGHVAIYLGQIDGTPYILEASWVGTPIHVVPLTRGDRDGALHRYWGTSNV